MILRWPVTLTIIWSFLLVERELTHIFCMYGKCNSYAQNNTNQRSEFSRPVFQASRSFAVLWYRSWMSVPVHLVMYSVLCLNVHTCICLALSRVKQKFCDFYIFEDWPQVLLTMYLTACVPGHRDALGRMSVSYWVVSLNPVNMAALGRALWQEDVTVLCSVPWSCKEAYILRD